MDNPRNDVPSHCSSNWKPVSKRQTQRRIKSAVQKFFNTSEMSAGVSGMPSRKGNRAVTSREIPQEDWLNYPAKSRGIFGS